jgi:peptidoglycan-N-acetylglucosamine deacetylase
MPIFQILFLLSNILLQPGQTDTRAIFHGSRDKKIIALTFDACPSFTHGGFDSNIIQVLVDSGVPATFFLSGKWIAKHRRDVKKLSAIRSFELGNHTYSHPHCTNISDDSVQLELQKADSLLKKVTGFPSHLFRPPYGETNGRIEGIAHKFGFITIMYDLASGDPDSTISKERLIRYVTTHARNGSIVVMHINGRGWYTAKSLPEIIQTLRARGFVFVKIGDLLALRNSDHLPSRTQKNDTLRRPFQ